MSRQSKLDDMNIRMQQMLLILSRGVTKADNLAADIEVSVRTIHRYIAKLRERGVPIAGQAGIGFMLRKHLTL